MKAYSPLEFRQKNRGVKALLPKCPEYMYEEMWICYRRWRKPTRIGNRADFLKAGTIRFDLQRYFLSNRLLVASNSSIVERMFGGITIFSNDFIE